MHIPFQKKHKSHENESQILWKPYKERLGKSKLTTIYMQSTNHTSMRLPWKPYKHKSYVHHMHFGLDNMLSMVQDIEWLQE
jgi:hypothetical protein